MKIDIQHLKNKIKNILKYNSVHFQIKFPPDYNFTQNKTPALQISDQTGETKRHKVGILIIFYLPSFFSNLELGANSINREVHL